MLTIEKRYGALFDWLDGISRNKWRFNAFGGPRYGIMRYGGSFYATDGVVLAKADIYDVPDCSFEWANAAFVAIGKDGSADIEYSECPNHPSIKALASSFVPAVTRSAEVSFNPAIVKRTMALFEKLKIDAYIATTKDRIEFTGHDEWISLRVVAMGKVSE